MRALVGQKSNRLIRLFQNSVSFERTPLNVCWRMDRPAMGSPRTPSRSPDRAPAHHARRRQDLERACAIDLQWFAAEDEGRTEDPTEYKIKKAREEGRVAKSQELSAALGLLMPVLLLLFLAPYMLDTCLEMVNFFLTRSMDLDPLTDRYIYLVCLRYLAKVVAPLLVIALVSGVFSNVVQTGFLFTVKPLTPKFSKVLPKFGEYFKRSFFSMEGLFNLAKSMVKIAIIGIVAFFTIRGEIEQLARVNGMGVWAGLSYVGGVAVRLVIIAALLLLVLSIPDFFFQRHTFKESLKMTKQEIKEERKMYEGDPLVKGRLRQRMRELLSQNMAVNVPNADVVITNPTHFAVALEWNRQTMPAPMLTAKGADDVAQRIKAIARENGVPIVENKPLARTLYAELEIGDTIPEQYYQVIATVLAQVNKINEARGRVLMDA